MGKKNRGKYFLIVGHMILKADSFFQRRSPPALEETIRYLQTQAGWLGNYQS